MIAYRSDMSVFINSPYIEQTEVFFLAFPRFNGSQCNYYTLCDDCRARVDEALATAREVVSDFLESGRSNATAAELKKAFGRYAQFRCTLQSQGATK